MSNALPSTEQSTDRKDPPDAAAVKRNMGKSKKAPSYSTSKEDIVEETLDRLTQGIPKHELRMYVSEANECEEALKRDIELLEKALEEGDKPGSNPALDEMIESPFTPLDRYWTASALLGRMRGAMAPPSLFYDLNKTNNKANSKAPVPIGAKSSQEAQNLLDMMAHPAYTRTEPTANILGCWKKIFSNRAAIVFKKPVKDEEAPGYSERIQFPMDLSLVRKMIVTRHITSYQQLHSYIGLIAHNCVKYNGRETDYGVVAREFEAMADEIIRQAVIHADNVNPPTAATAAAPPVTTPVSSRISSATKKTTAAAPPTASAEPPSTSKQQAMPAPPSMVSKDSQSKK
ncbi:hypothetical protein ACA910_000747 [Epithemia clementina (nom. ined.)]